MRPPQHEDHQRDAQPSQRLNAQVGLLAAHVVYNIVQSAQSCNAAADAGRHIFVPGHVDADSVRRSRVLAHRPQVQTDPCAEQHPAGNQRDDDGQEEQHAHILDAVRPVRKGPAEKALGAGQVLHRIQLVDDYPGQAHTEGGQGQACHVLVGPQGDGQGGINESAQQAEQQAAEDAHQHDQERRQVALAHHAQEQASARSAHAHDAGNAQVQVSGFLRQDFTGGSVDEYRAEGEGVKQEIQPDIHLIALLAAFFACPRKWTS